MDSIKEAKTEFLKICDIPEGDGGSIAICVEAMIYLFAGAVQNLTDFKIEFLTE